MVNLCIEYHLLPDAGGLMDQKQDYYETLKMVTIENVKTLTEKYKEIERNMGKNNVMKW